MYERTDFAYIDRRLSELSCEAYTNGFDIVSIETRDDWVSPGDLIVRVYMRRQDLDLSDCYDFRSNGKYVSTNSTASLRSKVRNRYRQLVYKMERRLNRTTPDDEGLYRRMTYDDC